MGPQGSGKGTIARRILDKHDLRLISMGEILRNSPKAVEYFEDIKHGNFAPDTLIYDIVSDYLDYEHEFLTDGFPRNLDQANWLLNWAGDNFDIRVIYLDVPESVTWERINKRIASGERRADDSDTDAINTRLRLFAERTYPLLEYFKDQQIKIHNIDAARDLEEIVADALAAIR
ncbi:adenylate kinase [Bacteroidia bacterium]|nr:adenylate kinase [Bacteroidia bacterium]